MTAANDTVLFIDEIHTLVGAGAADGATDPADRLIYMHVEPTALTLASQSQHPNV